MGDTLIGDKLHGQRSPNSIVNRVRNLEKDATAKRGRGTGSKHPPTGDPGTNQVPIVHIEDVVATIVPAFDSHGNYRPFIRVNIAGDYATIRGFVGYEIRVFPPIGAVFEVVGPAYPLTASPVDIHNLPSPPHDNETWRLQIRVNNSFYGEGFWSADIPVTYGGDTVAPLVPTWPVDWLVLNSYNWGAHETQLIVYVTPGLPLDADLDKFVYSISTDGGITYIDQEGLDYRLPQMSFRHLAPGSTVYIKRKAQDTSGNQSAYSSAQPVVVAGAAAPAAPTTVHETSNIYDPVRHLTTVQVAFTASTSAGVNGYYVHLLADGSATIDADIGLATYFNFELVPDQRYHISFAAHNLEGQTSAYTIPLDGVASSATNPAAPTLALATATFNPPLGYSWQRNGATFGVTITPPPGVSVDHYLAELHVTGQPAGVTIVIPGTATGWSFDGLARTVGYTLTMHTVDTNGHVGTGAATFPITVPNELVRFPTLLGLDTGGTNPPLGYGVHWPSGGGYLGALWTNGVPGPGQPAIANVIFGVRRRTDPPLLQGFELPGTATGYTADHLLPATSLVIEVWSLTGYGWPSTHTTLPVTIPFPFPGRATIATPGAAVWDESQQKFLIPLTWTTPGGYGNERFDWVKVFITEAGVSREVVLPGTRLSYLLPINPGNAWSRFVVLTNEWNNAGANSNTVSGTAVAPPTRGLLPNGSFEIPDPIRGDSVPYLWRLSHSGTASDPDRYSNGAGTPTWDGFWGLRFTAPTGSANTRTATSQIVRLSPPPGSGDPEMIQLSKYNLTLVAHSAALATGCWNVTVRGYDDTKAQVYTRNLAVRADIAAGWSAYRYGLFAGGPTPGNVVAVDFVLSVIGPTAGTNNVVLLDDVQFVISDQQYRISPGAVTSTEIADGSVVNSKIGAGAVKVGNLLLQVGAGGNEIDLYATDGTLLGQMWVNHNGGGGTDYFTIQGVPAGTDNIAVQMLAYAGVGVIVGRNGSPSNGGDVWLNCDTGMAIRFQVGTGDRATFSDHAGWNFGMAESHVTRTVTAARTLDQSDCRIRADASSAAFSITLPPATGVGGRTYMIKKIDTSANIVTITPDGTDTIEGNNSVKLVSRWAYIVLVSDGISRWEIYGK